MRRRRLNRIANAHEIVDDGDQLGLGASLGSLKGQTGPEAQSALTDDLVCMNNASQNSGHAVQSHELHSPQLNKGFAFTGHHLWLCGVHLLHVACGHVA